MQQLIIWSDDYKDKLAIDLRDDITMTAVVKLMDALIMSYAYSTDKIWYSDGNIAIKGQANIRSYAIEMSEIEELPF